MDASNLMQCLGASDTRIWERVLRMGERAWDGVQAWDTDRTSGSIDLAVLAAEDDTAAGLATMWAFGIAANLRCDLSVWCSTIRR